MEGQGFNPIPNPGQPVPQPQPQPQPQPAPMAPAGGYAQSMDTALADNSDMPDDPVSGVTEPKKKKGLIIGIIVAVVIVVVAIVLVVVLSNSGDDGKRNTPIVVDDDDDKPKELTNTEKAQNKLRESDIERFVEAVKTYESANGGVSPFGTKFDGEKIGEFVKKYIDDKIDVSSVKSGVSLKCQSGESCKTIKDPDGKALYGWTVDLAEEAQDNAKIAYSNEKVDYIVHVYAHAICGDKEGTYISGSDDNQVALFYIEQGGKIVCGDSVSGLSNPGTETNVNKKSITRRNVLRENDMSRFLKAVAAYQVDNANKTPFGEIADNGDETIETNYSTFVRKYIDSDVLVSTNTGTSCSTDEGCPRFRDPDGTLYNIKTYKPYDYETVFQKVRGMNHTIYVFVKASCSERYTTTVKTAKKSNEIAVIYRLDGGNKFYCIDNSK
jgi:hypothetical protein